MSTVNSNMRPLVAIREIAKSPLMFALTQHESEWQTNAIVLIEVEEKRSKLILRIQLKFTWPIALCHRLFARECARVRARVFASMRSLRSKRWPDQLVSCSGSLNWHWNSRPRSEREFSATCCFVLSESSRENNQAIQKSLVSDKPSTRAPRILTSFEHTHTHTHKKKSLSRSVGPLSDFFDFFVVLWRSLAQSLVDNTKTPQMKFFFPLLRASL